MLNVNMMMCAWPNMNVIHYIIVCGCACALCRAAMPTIDDPTGGSTAKDATTSHAGAIKKAFLWIKPLAGQR